MRPATAPLIARALRYSPFRLRGATNVTEWLGSFWDFAKMAGRVFGSAIAGLVAIGAAHAGKKIVIPDSADMFAELYALEELCPTMKIDPNAVAQFASRSLIDADTLQ